jgi:hypothetical protein
MNKAQAMREVTTRMKMQHVLSRKRVREGYSRENLRAQIKNQIITFTHRGKEYVQLWGTHSHQVITFCLRDIERNEGVTEANLTIAELHLQELGWNFRLIGEARDNPA